MGIKFANNASALLDGAITNSATSITLDDVSEFPALTVAGNYAFLTLANSAATKIFNFSNSLGVSINNYHIQLLYIIIQKVITKL